MSSDIKIPETLLYELWQKQNFNSPLKTQSGEEIAILDPGNRNDDNAGPDFKNCRLRIGNLTFVGDIEIDPNYSDWKNHGHNIDNKYNSIILHASLINKSHQAYVYTRNGRKVPSICFANFIESNQLNEIKKNFLDEDQNEHLSKYKCSELCPSLANEVKEKFLIGLGIERFNKKCKKIYSRLKELQFLSELKLKEPAVSYDLSVKFHEKQFKHSDFTNKEIWNQLFYELVFEALGFSKNKLQMTTLAQYANLEFVKRIEPDGILIDKYESALFYIAGLVKAPENFSNASTKQYVEKLLMNWNLVKPFYDGKYLDEPQWHFFRLRPQNFPTVRIAAGARLLKNIAHDNIVDLIAKKISEIHNTSVLINSIRSIFIVKAEGFWKNHFVFEQTSNTEIKYFVGATRADEIIVNVILPYFGVFFEIFGNKNIAKKVLKIFTQYEQHSDNQIILDVSEAIGLNKSINRTIITQGMIELFRNFCSKNKCLECEIGTSVFN
jgi:hypothetical protein